MYSKSRLTLESQNGMALLMAIMIVALVAIISVNILTQRQMQIYRTSNLYFRGQAYQYSLGVERWGMSVLAQDFKLKGGSSAQGGGIHYDSYQDVWNTALVNYDVEQATISGTIFDLQGRFNLNNLVVNGKVNTDWLKSYQRLLKSLDLPVSLADTLVDWIDQNEQPTANNGAEDIYYIALEQPYRAANQPLVHASELLLIKGYTHEVIKVLKPHVFVAQEKTTVNVNTASLNVLQAVIPGLSVSEAETLISTIEYSPFTKTGDLMKDPMVKNKKVITKHIGVTSQYFSINSYALVDKIQVNLQSIVHRDSKGNSKIRSRQELFWYQKPVVTDK